MCKFLSVLALKNGDILWDAYTDSHEQLIDHYGLEDSKEPSINRFVRIEYNPVNRNDYDNPNKYVLKVDESQTPSWFEDVREEIEGKLQAIIKRIILKDVTKKCLLSGVYILTGKTKIDYCINTRIFSMHKTSQVGEMRGTSQVGVMWGTSQVGEMRGTSQVGEMRGTSQVGVMWGTSQVGEMWGTSQVGEMWGTSKVGEMRGTSQVGAMWGTSKVGVMWGTSQVGVMWDTSQVGEMRDTSQVGEMRDTSKEVIVKDYRISVF